MITRNITFAVLDATDEEREALEEVRRAIEEIYYDRIDRLESQLFDELTPKGKRIYAELDTARWLRGADLTAGTWSAGRRAASMMGRLARMGELAVPACMGERCEGAD